MQSPHALHMGLSKVCYPLLFFLFSSLLFLCLILSFPNQISLGYHTTCQIVTQLPIFFSTFFPHNNIHLERTQHKQNCDYRFPILSIYAHSIYLSLLADANVCQYHPLRNSRFEEYGTYTYLFQIKKRKKREKGEKKNICEQWFAL